MMGGEIKADGIYFGDAYELIKHIPDGSVDLILTDPPYDFGGTSFGGLTKKMKYTGEFKDFITGYDYSLLTEMRRVMKKVNIYLWCNKAQIKTYLEFFHGCNFEVIIWGKSNPPPFTNGHYLKDKEYCLYFWEKGVKVHPTYETGKTVYLSKTNVKDKKSYGHPTIKPLQIIKNLELNSSERGGTILDPMMGSGTTCVAAKELGRKYIGFEIDRGYFEIAKRRIEETQEGGSNVPGKEKKIHNERPSPRPHRRG